jgi:hypothetical protein
MTQTVVRLLAITALLAVLVLEIIGVISLAEASFGAGIVLVAVLVIALPAARLADITGIKAFGMLELTIAGNAIDKAPSAGISEGGEVANDDYGDEISKLQLLLEAKLAYVAKHLIGFRPSGHWAPFLTIGSLEYDGYLSRADALAAKQLLGLRAAELNASSEEEKRRYLKKAKPFVGSIRATIFHGVVKKTLSDLDLHPRDLDRGKGRRPDFVLKSGTEDKVMAFPAFVGGGYWNDERIRERAEELSEEADRALIVVPPVDEPPLPPATVEGTDNVFRVPLNQLAETKRKGGLGYLLPR